MHHASVGDVEDVFFSFVDDDAPVGDGADCLVSDNPDPALIVGFDLAGGGWCPTVFAAAIVDSHELINAVFSDEENILFIG